MTLTAIEKTLKQEANPEQAKQLSRFFKTGPGEYGEGDEFLGIKVPVLRKIAKVHQALSLADVKTLLSSPIHEKRFLALAILVLQFSKQLKPQEKIANFYLRHKKWINNWDLIDTSAPHILGVYFFNKPHDILYELANSTSLWDRRIAILTTFYFIRQNDFTDTLQLAEHLLKDEHDLIHKAVGWMIREVGKRNFKVADQFVNQYYQTMPRTMLRYAIEQFPDSKRRYYMKK